MTKRKLVDYPRSRTKGGARKFSRGGRRVARRGRLEKGERR